MNEPADSRPAIRVLGLSKQFGTLRAVDGVSFDVAPGQVIGFIGANGAGKTTTMRMMATLEHPDDGVIEIDGVDVVQEPGVVRRKVGWMPDAYGTYDAMTVWEYLDFFVRAYGFHGVEAAQRVAEVMAFTDLESLRDRPMNALSKGMNQRLCLARTLLPDPGVLILDEPAAGLDPKARIEFKQLVRLLAKEGKTLFISSHILSELEEMCDSMLFIDQGKIVHHGTAESLKRRDGMPVLVRVEVDGPVESLLQWAELFPDVEVYDSAKNSVRLRVLEGKPDHLHDVLKVLLREGFRVTDYHRETVKLEDAFVDILTKVGEGADHAS